MSADNWAACPRCKDNKVDKVAELEKQMEEAYGKVALHVYRDMEQALVVARAEAEKGDSGYSRDNTFREDYEIYGAEKGVITVSYGGSCTVCGLRLEFQEDHPFYPPIPVQMSTDFPGTPFGRGDTIMIMTQAELGNEVWRQVLEFRGKLGLKAPELHDEGLAGFR